MLTQAVIISGGIPNNPPEERKHTARRRYGAGADIRQIRQIILGGFA
jgi:hypothetical protein